MHVASNQKVVRPPAWQPPPRDASPRLFRPKGCPNVVRRYCFPHRHAPSCRLCSRGPRVLAFLGSLTCKIEKERTQNCDAYHRRVASFFVYHNWGTGRRSRQAPCGEAAVRVGKWTARICRKLVGDVTRGWMSHACSFRAAIKHERAHGVGRTRRNPAAAERQGRRRSRRLSTAAIAA
jgi:hypothetical protein